MGRLTFAALSTENLLHNLSVVKKVSAPAKIIAMVKANAYGHGIRSVALRLDGLVDMLGVSSIDEALALRKVGVRSPILLCEGVFQPYELVIASAENFHVVFHTPEQVAWLARTAPLRPLNAWIKINTGMSRLGFSPEDFPEIYNALSHSAYVLKPLHVMSHLACSDDPSHVLNSLQTSRFAQLTKDIEGVESSLCASAGIFAFPHTHYDYVRPGLCLYGISPFSDKTATDLNLKPVMTLHSSLIAVNNVPSGSTVGYGGRYKCSTETRIGVVSVGYGDGYPITAKDGTPVLVNNVRCPLIGRVSMDMITVDLSHCPRAQVGDPVILWGQGLPLEEVTTYTQSICYQIVTGVQHRVHFMWSQ